MNKIALLASLIILSCTNKKGDLGKDIVEKEVISDTISKTENGVNSTTNNHQERNSEKSAIDSSLLIIPGKSIGNTAILDDSATLKKFGRPSFSDAAMGKAWLVWKGNEIDAAGEKSTLAVYITYYEDDMSRQVVKKIRITSADFKTEDGVHTGMNLQEIKKIYSNLQLSRKFKNRNSQLETSYFTIENSGIAFEFQKINNHQICVAIMVAPADEIQNIPYLDLDLEEIQR